MEEVLMSAEEREQVEFILNLIPAEDRAGLNENDVLFILDAEDDFLESQGLTQVDKESGEVTYLDGEVDETAELEFVREAVRKAGRQLSDVQIQLIMDGELQYGIKQGWYEEEDD